MNSEGQRWFLSCLVEHLFEKGCLADQIGITQTHCSVIWLEKQSSPQRLISLNLRLRQLLHLKLLIVIRDPYAHAHCASTGGKTTFAIRFVKE